MYLLFIVIFFTNMSYKTSSSWLELAKEDSEWVYKHEQIFKLLILASFPREAVNQ